MGATGEAIVPVVEYLGVGCPDYLYAYLGTY